MEKATTVKQAEELILQFDSSRISFAEEEEPHIVVSLKDITDRRRMEAAVRERQHLNELLLDALPHPAMLISKGRTILAANRIAREAGAKIGSYCWQSFGHGEFILEQDKKCINAHKKVPPSGTHCCFCLADEALKNQEPTNNPGIRAWDKKIWNARWIPLSKEMYLHYAIDVTEEGRAQDRLRESEKRYRTLFESAGEGILIADIQTKEFKYGNPAICRMLGYSEEELTEMGVSDIHPKDALAHVISEFGAQAKGEKALAQNIPCLRKDGTILYADINTTKASVDGRESNIGFFTDKTERKKAEDALRYVVEGTASTTGGEFFQSLVKCLASALGIRYALVTRCVDSPPTRVRAFAFWNGKKFGEIFEYGLEGTPCENVVAGKICYYPKDIQKLFPNDKDLAKLNAESYLGLPFTDSQGNVIGHLAVLDDKPMVGEKDSEHQVMKIFGARAGAELERIIAEEKLRQSENKYRILLENLPQTIFFKDKNSVYISCNENYARDLKIKPDEITGKTDYDFYPKRLAGKYRADDRRIVKSGKIEDIEEEYIQDGQKVFVHTVKTPVKNENGNVVGILGIFWDITEQKKVQEDLQQHTWKLSERVKELSCLYETSRLMSETDRSLGEICQGIDDLIRAGWQYPDITCARIIINGHHFETDNFNETAWKQSADIMVSSKKIGSVEVYYLEEKPALDEGPFLEEERNVIDIVATEMGRLSDRREMENRLRESEEKHRSLITNVPDITWTTDSEGSTIFISPNVERVYGYTQEEIYGAGGNLWFGRIHSDDVEKVKEAYRTLFKKNKLFDIEYRIKRKDGNWIWSHDRAVTTYEKDGILYADGVFSDITKRKRADESLRKSENRFQELWDDAPVGYHTLDTNGIITRVNETEAKMLGHTKEQMVGKSIFQFIPPEQRKDANQRFKRKLAGERISKAEDTVYLRKDGREMFVSIDDVLERDSSGKAIGIRATMVDVTREKLLQEQLIRSEKLAAIGELISGVAHEMNNPLTAVTGFAQLLKEEARGLDKDRREQLEMICSEAMRVRKIVSNLLSFARKHKAQKRGVSINSIVETVLDMRGYELRVHNINVNKELEEKLPHVEADTQQIEQVFLNIINNAEQAMVEAHGKGNLTVRTYTSDNVVRAEFVDDGTGIPKENLRKIFDPFFTTKEVGKGTGLGLSVSYGIMKEHNGNILAESKKRKGAKFIIELPVMKGGFDEKRKDSRS